MRQSRVPSLKQRDRKLLNGGLFGAVGIAGIAMLLATFGGHAIKDGETLAQVRADLSGKFSAIFSASASEPQPRIESVEPLMVDFQTLVPALQPEIRVATLRRRSTLNDALVRLGADPDSAATALNALYEADYLNPRRLQAGLEINASFDQRDGQLIAITLKPEAERSVIAKRTDEGDFFAAELNVQLTPVHRRVAATIETSIYDAALSAGARDQQVADFAQIFGFDVDFQREIHQGDSFEIVYETFVDERGNQIRSGEVLYASLDGRALTRGYYRHTPEDSENADYFTSEGKSATRFLMRTPINGARLSSSFGRRRHPISGYSRLHKGTDFAAPRGTPIFAAGNGVVERASRYGGYGKYVRIQHDSGYETAYAHMSRYGPGVRRGRRVRQGDIIGYVGSTGASTGPHLHYEVLINGNHVNAMQLGLPTGRKLEGDLLSSFQETRANTDALRLREGAEIELVAAVTNEEAG